jgi:hypothetical protein
LPIDYIILAAIIFSPRRFPVERIFSGATGNSTTHRKKPF